MNFEVIILKVKQFFHVKIVYTNSVLKFNFIELFLKE